MFLTFARFEPHVSYILVSYIKKRVVFLVQRIEHLQQIWLRIILFFFFLRLGPVDYTASDTAVGKIQVAKTKRGTYKENTDKDRFVMG